ncbi:MAG TPA: twin-arginine translocase TatA/TatE family subunit [Planctomycetota bacterium]|nr:twin-arginine translocase TatA/TatE family subunit [Planctomycetota bacterium]
MFLAEFAAWQLILLLAAVLLLFGARIPETMRNLGKGVSEFKKGIREGEEGERPEKREESPKP